LALQRDGTHAIERGQQPTAGLNTVPENDMLDRVALCTMYVSPDSEDPPLRQSGAGMVEDSGINLKQSPRVSGMITGLAATLARRSSMLRRDLNGNAEAAMDAAPASQGAWVRA
jgi:hypothetical protein